MRKYGLLLFLTIQLILSISLYATNNVTTSKVNDTGLANEVPKQVLTPTTTLMPNGQIKLMWNSIIGATGYNIYQCSTPAACTSPTWTLLATLPATSLSYQFTPVSQTKYYYVTYDSSSLPPHFVEVEGGTFNNGFADITISSFCMDKYEMTQGGYEAVMGFNPANTYGVSPDRPVFFVSWFNAVEFCNRRSMQDGLTPCYTYYGYGTDPDNWPAGWNLEDNNQADVECNWSANGYRMPTAMEWIFAAKGGNLSHGYTYSGSNDVNEVAWWGYFTGGNSGMGCHPVGTLAPNELGIYDMSGNLYEWVWDRYGDYPSTPQTDPHGPEDGVIHEFHGGCWGWFAEWCEVTYRRTAGASDNTMPGVSIRLIRKMQ